MKKSLAFLFVLVFLVTSFTSCSRAPKIEEIKDRLAELISDAYIVNKIFFGTGFETYERIYEPNLILYKDDVSGKEYQYFEIIEEDRTIIVYTEVGFFEGYKYLEKETTKRESEVEIIKDEDGNYYYELLEYEWKMPEIYYKDTDPAYYDYVKFDEEHASINEIKNLAEKVYAKEFCESMYVVLFDGIATSQGTELARYMEYSHEGSDWFMQRNDYMPYAVDKHIFMIDTAEIVSPSKKNRVIIHIDAYYESDPTNIENVRLVLVQENGVWLLDTATY